MVVAAAAKAGAGGSSADKRRPSTPSPVLSRTRMLLDTGSEALVAATALARDVLVDVRVSAAAAVALYSYMCICSGHQMATQRG